MATADFRRLVNRDLNPLLASLPEWVKGFRPGQIKAIDEIVRAFETKPVVVLDAPTGSGKTLIAECVRRMLDRQAIYVCSSKNLQDQFAYDFPYARVIKGRSNYATERYADSWPDISAEDCTATRDHPGCRWCDAKSECPYERAKAAAASASLAVANYPYCLTEWNGPGRLAGRPLIVADEGDVLEDQIMAYASVRVSERVMRRYRWTAPKVTVEEDWAHWIDGALPDIQSHMAAIARAGELDRQTSREWKYLRGLNKGLVSIRRGLDDGTTKWVYTGDRERVEWKPVRVASLGRALWWQHGQRFLLMSATVISADHILKSTGYDGPYSVVRMDSTFPKENRKVYILPVANMARKNNGADNGRMVSTIADVLRRHGQDRVLVHSVSYALTEIIGRGLSECGRPVYVQRLASQRGALLAEYRRTGGAVLVSPSLDRGVDLPGDACRVQIIVKMPFMPLGDRQVNARLYGGGSEGQTWYTIYTVRSLVQMSGRGVRHQEDWATTYVLDSQFNQLWNKARHLFPKWFREALEWNRKAINV